MRGETISAQLLQRVTVVIRSVGERTEDACRTLVLEQGVPPEAVFVVRERPFSKALRLGSEIGLEQGRKWTLFVDADLLLRRGSIERMVVIAEGQPASVCQVVGYCLDKFFGGARLGGMRCYRTSLLDEFIGCIPDEGVDIRPESNALKEMASKGFPCFVTPQLTALHDFEQSYDDIFRKCFVYAHKHSHLQDFFLSFWGAHADVDADYRVALAGFKAGSDYVGPVRIDKNAPYFSYESLAGNFARKSNLVAGELTLNEVEDFVQNWQEPEAYWAQFPSGMWAHETRRLARLIISLRLNIARIGPVKGLVLVFGSWQKRALREYGKRINQLVLKR